MLFRSKLFTQGILPFFGCKIVGLTMVRYFFVSLVYLVKIHGFLSQKYLVNRGDTKKVIVKLLTGILKLLFKQHVKIHFWVVQKAFGYSVMFCFFIYNG